MSPPVDPALVLEQGVVLRLFRPSQTQITVFPTGEPIDGNDGTNGTDGKTILNGVGAPLNTLGTDGDFYMDTSPPKTLYGPKASGVWPTPGFSLQGDQGPAGSGGGHPFLYS